MVYEYLILDYTKAKDGDKPKFIRIYGDIDKLFEWLDKAKRGEVLISVYKIENVLDWS